MPSLKGVWYRGRYLHDGSVTSLEELFDAAVDLPPDQQARLIQDAGDLAPELKRLLAHAPKARNRIGGVVREAALSIAPADWSARRFGPYRVVHEIGRGGMGVVYEALQLSLGRRVALKILPLAAALDRKHLQRFKNEAQAAAQLHHTNIVPVYAVGSERGVHYYSMQLIEGYSLADLIEHRRQLLGKSISRGFLPPTEKATTAKDFQITVVGSANAGGRTYQQRTDPMTLSITAPQNVADIK